MTIPVPETTGSPSKRRSLLLSMLAMGGLMAAFVSLCWIAFGRLVAQKIATELVQPVGLLTLVLATLVLHAIREKDARWATYSSLPLIFLLLTGNGLIANWQLGMLEVEYRSLDPLSAPKLDVLAVLGGGTSSYPNGRPQLNRSGDRIAMAARMFHAGKATQIVCTGSRIESLSTSSTDGADRAEEILLELGVPGESIRQVEGRNTSEEIANLKKFLQDSYQEEEPNTGILTSAWHMRRALALADRHNLSLSPIPANFMTGETGELTWASIVRGSIPNAGALHLNSMVVRERLGALVGR